VFINIAIICLVALTVNTLLRRDFDKGIAAAVFFLILLPREVLIPMPGALPELTGHRVVLLILLMRLFPRLRWANFGPISPLVTLLCVEGVCRLLSIITSIEPMESVKSAIDYWIETVLFFALVACALRQRRTIELVAWSSLVALVIVALIGAVEKYRSINLVAEVIPDFTKYPNEVTATFRHRILFGYAMAMGFPLAVVIEGPERGWKRWFPTFGVLSLLAASYFSGSRGPWVGCAMAGVVLVMIAGRTIRRKLIFVGVIGVLLLATRPGVYDTIANLWGQSFDQSTVKGRSTDYRRILWTIAYDELTKSPGTTAFGYGGHSTELMDVSEYFETGAGGTTAGLGHTSWDSQLASDLMQFGFIGFAVELLIYFTIFKLVWRSYRFTDATDRQFMAGCIAMFAIFFWALATVAIFNPQLFFLFWVFVAIAGKYYSLPRDDQHDELTNGSDELIDDASSQPTFAHS
jgi:hypothetical protein